MRRILFIYIMLLGWGAAMAAQLNPSQLKLRTDIYNYLKKIGTNVAIVDEEQISFSANDIKFWVHVSPKDFDPMYVTITAGFGLGAEYDKDLALQAGFESASGMPVYVATSDETIIFDCEMYVRESKAFTSVLPAMITALTKSASNFGTEYNKIAAAKPTSTSDNISTLTNTNNNGVYEFPEVTGGSNDAKFYLTKVTVDERQTILDITSYNNRQASYCGINRNSYIIVNSQRLKLTKAEGIAYVPNHTDYPNADSGKESSLSFRLFFPALPKGTTSFDFQESENGYEQEGWLGDGWFLRGIKLDNHNCKTLSSERIETSVHTWWATGINCQETQTVVMKSVKPKSNGTYMFSSYDEFIEDADTGRKYYLIKSSIGFSSNPLISHNTNTVNFAEVYPALPKSVKRINISSGDQYYVKNLQIR